MPPPHCAPKKKVFAALAITIAAATAACERSRDSGAATIVHDAAAAASLDGVEVKSDPSATTLDVRLSRAHAAPWHRIATFLLALTRDRGGVVLELSAAPMPAETGSVPKPLAGDDASSPIGCSGDVYRDWSFETALAFAPAASRPAAEPLDAAEAFFHAMRALREAPESASLETVSLHARARGSAVDVRFTLATSEPSLSWESLRARAETACACEHVELVAPARAGDPAELRMVVRSAAREPRAKASLLEPPVRTASPR